MSVDKLVDSTQLDADLTSVANAIRTKGGTSAQLAFPAGFVSAINDISGGVDISDIASGAEPSGAITITSTKLRDYCFYNCLGITSLIISNNIPWQNWGVSAFYGCKNLVSVFAPNLTQLRQKIFNQCSALVNVSFPKVATIAGDQVIESTKVVTLVFPAFTGEVYNNSLRYNSKLTSVDFNAVSRLGITAFSGCTSFNTLIIRGSSVPTLSNISTFKDTPFASGKAGGILYVPNSMIASYQAASNWSTILGYANNQIEKIEGTTYETHYADGTVIS